MLSWDQISLLQPEYDRNTFITLRMTSHKSFRAWVMIANYGNLTTLGNNPVSLLIAQQMISILLTVTVLRLELHV